jgi:hypothetical protein
MTDFIIYYMLHLNYIVIILLFIAKIVLFAKLKKRKWKSVSFLYINFVAIKLTASPVDVKFDKAQKSLSLSMLGLFILNLIVVLFVDN